jgi:sialidase-1
VLNPSTTTNTSTLSFNGTSSYIQVPNSTDFDFGTGDFTWSLWVDYQVHANYSGLLVTGITNNEYRLKFQGSGQYLYLQNADGDSQVANLGTNITGTGWHHLCLVRSLGTITTYLDGSAVDTDSRAGNVNSNGNDLLIGKNGNDYFNGKMDEIAMWNKAITSCDVVGIYQASSNGITADLSTVYPSNLKYYNRMGD